MIRKLLCGLAALGLLGLPVSAQDYPALYDVKGVAAGDVLNIRSEPSSRAPAVGSFAPDARGIEVVGAVGGWAKVNHGEGTGYASLTYLRPANAPVWSSLDAPLACFGTEPFWGMTYSPDDRSLAFDMFDMLPTRTDVTQLWPAGPRSAVVALGVEGGTVVLTGEECSDGMSDFTYGIAVDVLIEGAAGPDSAGRYSGCCSLILR